MKRFLFLIALSFIFQINNAQITNLTPDVHNVSEFVVSGENVAWLQHDGNDIEVFVYYKSTNQTIQITNNSIDEANISIDGNSVVWNSALDGDHEIYLYDGLTTTQITNNTVLDVVPEISGANIVWQRNSGTAGEVIFYNGTIETALTADAFSDGKATIYGNKVVWEKYEGTGKYSVAYYDGSTITNLSGYQDGIYSIKIHGDNFIWSQMDQSAYDPYSLQYYNGSTQIELTDNLAPGTEVVGEQIITWTSFDGDHYYYDGNSTKQINFGSGAYGYLSTSGNNISLLHAGNNFLYIFDSENIYTVNHNNFEFGDIVFSTISGNDFYWLAQPDTAGLSYKNIYKYTMTDFEASFTNNVHVCVGEADTLINTTITTIPLEYNTVISSQRFQDSSFITPVKTLNEGDTTVLMMTATDGIKIDTAFGTKIVHITPTLVVDSIKDETCAGICDGAIYLSSDAAMPAEYSWSNDSTGAHLTGLCQDYYTATVTGAYGCSGAISSITAIEVSGPSMGLGTTVEKINTDCNKSNGIAQATMATGGTSPYSYSWSNDSTGSTITNLSEGKFYLTVTDDNGCEKIDSAIIDFNLPDTTNICLVSVDKETGKNMIIWEKNPDNAVEKYLVSREGISSGDWDEIGQVFYDSLTVFVDMTSDPEVKSYKYKILAIDSCGNESVYSPIHKTMLLTSSISQQGINLSWTEYVIDNENFGFASYIIYRGSSPFQLDSLDQIASDNTLYPDYNPLDGINYYRIEGILPGDPCDPAGLLGKKANNGPFSRSISNLEDNRLQSTGINSESLTGVEVYPNPMTTNSMVRFNNSSNSLHTIKLINMVGEVVLLEKVDGSEIEISKGNLNAGLYIIEITGDGNYTGKLIVQ